MRGAFTELPRWWDWYLETRQNAGPLKLLKRGSCFSVGREKAESKKKNRSKARGKENGAGKQKKEKKKERREKTNHNNTIARFLFLSFFFLRFLTEVKLLLLQHSPTRQLWSSQLSRSRPEHRAAAAPAALLFWFDLTHFYRTTPRPGRGLVGGTDTTLQNFYEPAGPTHLAKVTRRCARPLRDLDLGPSSSTTCHSADT